MAYLGCDIADKAGLVPLMTGCAMLSRSHFACWKLARTLFQERMHDASQIKFEMGWSLLWVLESMVLE